MAQEELRRTGGMRGTRATRLQEHISLSLLLGRARIRDSGPTQAISIEPMSPCAMSIKLADSTQNSVKRII